MHFILLPLSLIYNLITFIRNKLFDIEFFSSQSFEIPIISVGNLSVGGEGKTPHVEYIINMLQNKYQIAILSRGYKRETTGFVIAETIDTHKKIGDESLQLKIKFPNCIVAVCESRRRGVNKIISNYKDVDLIILDDAFQHRWVKPNINILITSYEKPFYKNYILPAGTLREGRYGKKRADIIIMSKCSQNINHTEKKDIIRKINPLKNQNIYFSHIKYLKWQSLFTKRNDVKNFTSFEKIILVTGIANAENIKLSLTEQGYIVEHIEYSDHYQFKKRNIIHILKKYNSEKSFKTLILTTEKDAVRLKKFEKLFHNVPVFLVPIEIKLDNEEKFKHQIINYVKKDRRN